MYSPLTDKLIKNLKQLPGIGPKSAQRMAFEILNTKRTQARDLATTLLEAIQQVKKCDFCQFWTESSLCNICQNPKRNNDILCVVESPTDVVAIEQTLAFKGKYYVLHGKLSPMDGIGPEQLNIPKLITNAQNFREVVLALTPSLESEATAHFIIDSMNNLDIKFTRIAQGVPMGGELDYLDCNTVAKAFSDRVFINKEQDVIS